MMQSVLVCQIYSERGSASSVQMLENFLKVISSLSYLKIKFKVCRASFAALHPKQSNSLGNIRRPATFIFVENQKAEGGFPIDSSQSH